MVGAAWRLIGLRGLLALTGAAVAGFLWWELGRARAATEAAQGNLRAAQEQVTELRAQASAKAQIETVTQYVDRWHTRVVTKFKEQLDADRAESTKALEANPDWASTLVPDAVLSSLR